MMPGAWNIRPALAAIAAGVVLALGILGGALSLLGAVLSSWGWL